MHTFRYNPVFEQWVMLGAPVVTSDVHPRSFIDSKPGEPFVVAELPYNPFLLDEPKEAMSHVQGKHFHRERPIDDFHLTHKAESPVGEYELILYRPDEMMIQWPAVVWEQWLQVLQKRLTNLHHNANLKHIYFSMYTRGAFSCDPYVRAGDLVATSHPICGVPAPLNVELAEKMRKKEHIFTLIDSEYGRVFVPSAPMYNKEIWIVPAEYRTGMEKIHKHEREFFAEVLHTMMSKLSFAFPGSHWAVILHTGFSDPKNEESTWWLQIYEDIAQPASLLNVRPLPEDFLDRMKRTLLV